MNFIFSCKNSILLTHCASSGKTLPCNVLDISEFLGIVRNWPFVGQHTIISLHNNSFSINKVIKTDENRQL